ncbi:sigma-70 family RNA polymerase sigma factor [Paenibacillus sp. FSL K6-2859]|uniref:sigma-70 family RNA polymerase sigma factor n=1 Tax=Paenibacillus sp. FSL K6-2859 TaxID=2921482 RepID=UPI0030FC719C
MTRIHNHPIQKNGIIRTNVPILVVKNILFFPYRYNSHKRRDSIMEMQPTVYERYKTEIYRIGWRLQYQAKKIRNRESSLYDSDYSSSSFTSSSEDKMLIQQLMNTLPPQGKVIIYKLYIQDLTESEVANELKISQQAVNKWKRKMIQKLSQMVSS